MDGIINGNMSDFSVKNQMTNGLKHLNSRTEHIRFVILTFYAREWTIYLERGWNEQMSLEQKSMK